MVTHCGTIEVEKTEKGCHKKEDSPLKVSPLRVSREQNAQVL